ERTAASEPRVLFGGVYDWYDPILAIEAIAIARESLPQISLTFTKHPNPDLTPQGKLADAMQQVKRRGFDFVRFEPWFAYDRRADTRDFVREHQWPDALQPLRDFCRKPRVDAQKDSFAVRMQVPERAPSMLERLKRRIGGAS